MTASMKMKTTDGGGGGLGGTTIGTTTTTTTTGTTTGITGMMTMITNNTQPYTFSIALDSNKNEISIQAKNRLTKDAFHGTFGVEQLRRIGFYQNIRGFYSRLKMALESKSPQELRAGYRLINKATGDQNIEDVLSSSSSIEGSIYDDHSNNNNSNNNNNNNNGIDMDNNGHSHSHVHAHGHGHGHGQGHGQGGGQTTTKKEKLEMKKNSMMALILEESSKYDDEPCKWCLVLKQLDIKDTEKLQEKLEDVVEVVGHRDREIKEQLNSIVKNVKQKFDTEKQKRNEIEQRVDICEQAIKKLGKMVKELQGQLNISQGKADVSNQSTADNLAQMNQQMHEQLQTLSQRFDTLEKQTTNEVQEQNRKLDEIRPKLARLKTRKDFPSEEAYVEYIGAKIKDWDAQKDGRILVRVNPEVAEGKAKHFIGYVGEPVKWNSTICKVQWFGLQNKAPESLEWKCLDVYLPLSAYYFPDCPQARLPDQTFSISTEKKL